MNNSFHKRMLPIKKFHKINIINDTNGFVYKFRKMIKDNRKKSKGGNRIYLVSI
jgi:hypothetical protein